MKTISAGIRIIILTLFSLILLSSFKVYAASENIKIEMAIGKPFMTVNGIEKEVDPGRSTTPIIKNNRTLVPVRSIVEAVYGSVDWDAKEEKVIIKKDNTTITLKIGSKIMSVNEINKEIDVAPEIINSRTMVPIRFIAENLGLYVYWDDKTKKVTISTTEIYYNDSNISDAKQTDPIIIKIGDVSGGNRIDNSVYFNVYPFGLYDFMVKKIENYYYIFLFRWSDSKLKEQIFEVLKKFEFTETECETIYENIKKEERPKIELDFTKYNVTIMHKDSISEVYIKPNNIFNPNNTKT